jgi:hypothetical protein
MNLLGLRFIVSRISSEHAEIRARDPPDGTAVAFQFPDLTAIRPFQWWRRLDPVVTFFSKDHPMKRFLATALIIGVSSFGLVGCEEKTEDKKVETVTTPKGKETVTETTRVEKSGDQKDDKTVPPATPETPK